LAFWLGLLGLRNLNLAPCAHSNLSVEAARRAIGTRGTATTDRIMQLPCRILANDEVALKQYVRGFQVPSLNFCQERLHSLQESIGFIGVQHVTSILYEHGAALVKALLGVFDLGDGERAPTRGLAIQEQRRAGDTVSNASVRHNSKAEPSSN
jgi:hypothetical protein